MSAPSDGRPHVCPSCGSDRVERARGGFMARVVLRVIGRRRYQCWTCGAPFYERPSGRRRRGRRQPSPVAETPQRWLAPFRATSIGPAPTSGPGGSSASRRAPAESPVPESPPSASPAAPVPPPARSGAVRSSDAQHPMDPQPLPARRSRLRTSVDLPAPRPPALSSVPPALPPVERSHEARHDAPGVRQHVCPRCESRSVQQDLSRPPAVQRMLLALLRQRRYNCRDCDRRFRDWPTRARA